MGGATSSLAKSVSTPVKWLFSWNKTGDSCQDEAAIAQRFGATPFVHKRRGSMYMDEDGDLAHEFFEEVPIKHDGDQGHRYKMVKKNHHLVPQGDVELPHPRLHVDFPAVLCEVFTGK
ncbi:tumor suppressor candidate 2-like [Liolophura sinensis]|uniref:tumor suppressor candidate 2-like n=1 Tax=Liolophura sinensis TaxID=3198878 RepID=UPI0031585B81